jgi:hypothetical protein
MTEDRKPIEILAPLEALRAFLEDMARFRVGDDDLSDPSFRATFAKEHELDSAEISEDDLIDALDAERLRSETTTFWEMIKRARLLLEGQGAQHARA